MGKDTQNGSSKLLVKFVQLIEKHGAEQVEKKLDSLTSVKSAKTFRLPYDEEDAVNHIVALVAGKFKVPTAEINEGRDGELGRFVLNSLYYLISTQVGWSYRRIAQRFEKKSHGSIEYGMRLIREEIRNNKKNDNENLLLLKEVERQINQCIKH